MEFDINRVYTAVNADEVKVGSKVVCANTIKDLKQKVEENDITEITYIKDECYENRFSIWMIDNAILGYALAYLVSEPEEKKLKWTDLKIGDVIKNEHKSALITAIDDDPNIKMHIQAGGSWFDDEVLEEWEKVEE